MTGNRGIQGTRFNIKANALAVGSRATATSTRLSGERRDLVRAIEQLGAAIARVPLEPAIRDTVQNDVDRLSELAQAPNLNRDDASASLSGIIAKLTAAGVVVSKVSALIEPTRKIADVIGLAMRSLG